MFDDFRKKFLYFKSFATKRLVQVNLQILYSCNFQCRICDSWTEPYSKMQRMSVPQIQIIANQLKQLGPKVISLCGGEPLMHKELLEITRILGENNFLIMVCNGWFVTPELAHALFKNPNVCQISVSLDYIDPVKHDQQRGKQGAFAHAVNALKILNAHRCYPHQRVHMISVVMDDNLEDIEPLIHLADQIGVTYLVTLYSHGHGKKESKVFHPQLGQYLLKLKRRYRHFVSIPGYLARFFGSGYPSPWRYSLLCRQKFDEY